MMRSLKAVTPEEREAFEQLRQSFLSQPAVAAFLQAQADLIEICQAAGDLISESTGLHFGSSACSSSCYG